MGKRIVALVLAMALLAATVGEAFAAKPSAGTSVDTTITINWKEKGAKNGTWD